jgi:hypothetical protein
MISFSRTLPQQFDQPLPLMMAQLTPAPKPANDLTTATIRQLADAIAAWHFRSPLGICLRRSLLRYYFLWEAGIPVRIVFGARLLRANEGDRIGGHAWLTLDGAPYYEDQQDYAPFAEMYHYPPDRAYPPDRPRRETQRIPDENQRNK